MSHISQISFESKHSHISNISYLSLLCGQTIAISEGVFISCFPIVEKQFSFAPPLLLESLQWKGYHPLLSTPPSNQHFAPMSEAYKARKQISLLCSFSFVMEHKWKSKNR